MFGFIESIRGNGAGGDGASWTLRISGRDYVIANGDVVRQLQPGDAVQFFYLQEGERCKILRLSKVPNRGPASSPWPRHDDERGKRISRMSCLKTAAQILDSKRLEPTRKAELVVEIARLLERYVLGEDHPAVSRRKVKP